MLRRWAIAVAMVALGCTPKVEVTCERNEECVEGTWCNLTLHQCVPGNCPAGTVDCTPTGQCEPSKPLGATGGPDICDWGQYCDPTTKACSAPASCPLSQIHDLSTHGASPIVFGVQFKGIRQAVNTADQTACPALKIRMYTASWYDVQQDVGDPAPQTKIVLYSADQVSMGNPLPTATINTGTDPQRGWITFEFCDGAAVAGFVLLDNAAPAPHESNIGCLP